MYDDIQVQYRSGQTTLVRVITEMIQLYLTASKLIARHEITRI